MKHGSGKTCPWIPLVHHQSNCFHILGCWLYRPGEWSHEWGNDLRFQQKNHPSSGGSASVVRPGLPGVHGVFCLQCHCAGGRSSALLVRPPSVVDGIPYLSILDTPSGIWTPSIYIGVVWVVNLGVYAVQCRHIYICHTGSVWMCLGSVLCVFVVLHLPIRRTGQKHQRWPSGSISERRYYLMQHSEHQYNIPSFART